MDTIDKELFVIAVLFNPSNYKTRIDLYNNFVSYMNKHKINLITVECIYGDYQNFTVTQKDNPNHIQLHADHPLWHKENLINIAIKRLPETWKYALWIDADIEFLEDDWKERILKSFEKYDVIQVFKTANFLGPDNIAILETHYSFLHSVVEKIPIDRRFYNLFYAHPGYGWGITRDAYEYLGKLIDFAIVGSGDSHMAYSFINKYEFSLCNEPNLFNKSYINEILKWQEKAFELNQKGKIGYAETSIKHFFHGYREDRNYVKRIDIIIDEQFDPIEDLYYNDEGVLQIKPNRKNLIDKIISYFENRNEDNKVINNSLPSMNIKYRNPEELLMDAEKLKEIIKNETDLEKNSNDGSDHDSDSENQGKKINYFYEFEEIIRFSTENSDESNSENELDNLNNFQQNQNQNSLDLNSMNLMNQYGACCSSGKPEKNYKSNSGGSNQNAVRPNNNNQQSSYNNQQFSNVNNIQQSSNNNNHHQHHHHDQGNNNFYSNNYY